MSAPVLTDGAVTLRALTPDDAEALFAAHSDPQTHRFWAGPPHTDVAQTRAYTEGTIRSAGGDAWAITSDGGPALGRIALFTLREGIGEIGVILAPDAAGRGYGRRAVDLVTAYAFETKRLHRLVADVDPENVASMTLFTRAGFAREALLRGNWKTHIGIRDTVLFVKLNYPGAPS